MKDYERFNGCYYYNSTLSSSSTLTWKKTGTIDLALPTVLLHATNNNTNICVHISYLL